MWRRNISQRAARITIVILIEKMVQNMKKPKANSNKLFLGNIRTITTAKLIQLIYFLLVFGGTAVLAQPPGKVYNVIDYGAVADNQTVNTTAIQKAINDCSAQGGGSVYISGGTYLTGTLFLKDNVTLYIEKGDTLKVRLPPIFDHGSANLRWNLRFLGSCSGGQRAACS